MARFESEGTWFAAEEVAKRKAFKVGDRVKCMHDSITPWFGTIYREAPCEGFYIRFEHDGGKRGAYRASELVAAPRPTVIGVDMKTGRLVDIAELAVDNSPLSCLRRLHATNHRHGMTLREAFDLAQQYHYHVGALIKEPARKSEAMVASEIARWLEGHFFYLSADALRRKYALPPGPRG